MKRNIRYFVAAVQCLYNKYITALMDMGNGYTHPEECYIPTFLYPELLRKSAEYNNIEWEEESFLKELECNKNTKYYCTNSLLKKIASSIGDNSRSGYKITECFDDMRLESETAGIVIAVCLFREGSFILKKWHSVSQNNIRKYFDNEMKELDLVIIYYLLFQTNSCMKINETCYQKYLKIWEKITTNDNERQCLEEELILSFFSIITDLSKELTIINNLETEISTYKNLIINGIKNNVLDAMREEKHHE